MKNTEANLSVIKWSPRSAEVAWDGGDKAINLYDDGSLHVCIDGVVLMIDRVNGEWRVEHDGVRHV